MNIYYFLSIVLGITAILGYMEFKKAPIIEYEDNYPVSDCENCKNNVLSNIDKYPDNEDAENFIAASQKKCDKCKTKTQKL